MSQKKNNLLGFSPFPAPDSVNANIVSLKVVKDVSFNMIHRKIWVIFPLMKKRKLKWNSIGGKMIKKYNKSLMTSKVTQMIKQKNQQKRKLELQFMNVSNFLRNQRFWDKKMHGSAPNVKILYWPKSRCKFIKPLRYWYSA